MTRSIVNPLCSVITNCIEVRELVGNLFQISWLQVVHQAQQSDKVFRLLLFGICLHVVSSEKGCKNPGTVMATCI
ncbi:hypothetical protein [Pantoea stewartii]|uniref:hypothetical protein n=1 Tax=Pantoea stewartii TaxID=66269 RepID=UPI0012ECAA1F|nr:hypothetical protein [Pantoea stewartii]